MLVGEDDDSGLERILARLQPRDLLARARGHAPLRVSLKASFLAATTRRTRMPSSLASTCAAALRVALPWMPSASVSGKKRKPLQAADVVRLDVDRAVLGDLGVELVLLLQPAHQRAGAAVDEALGEPLVQRIGQAVLDGARAVLPVLGIGQPVGAVGHERPGADVGDAVGKRVDIAVGAVGERHLLGEPVLRDALVAGPSGTCRACRPARHGSASRSCGSRGSGTLPTAG